jgi:DNA-binding NarL/FixJ family response regulator
MAGALRLRVLVADHQRMYREALCRAIAEQPDLEVVASVGDGQQALLAAQRTQPDVAVVDAFLPVEDGVQTTCSLSEAVPGCRVVVLAPVDDKRALSGSIECGASGFVTSDSSLEDLADAIRAVARGETLVPPLMLGTLLGGLVRRRRSEREARRRASLLTRREREVARLLARGADTPTIARALVISPETARSHIQSALGKLGVHSRLEAAAFLLENGIVEQFPVDERAPTT